MSTVDIGGGIERRRLKAGEHEITIDGEHVATVTRVKRNSLGGHYAANHGMRWAVWFEGEKEDECYRTLEWVDAAVCCWWWGLDFDKFAPLMVVEGAR